MRYCPNCTCASCEYERVLEATRAADAAERAAGNPPVWTPEQRARLSMTMRSPAVSAKISAGVRESWRRRKAAQEEQHDG